MPSITPAVDDDLLKTSMASELMLADLTGEKDSIISSSSSSEQLETDHPTKKRSLDSATAGQNILLRRAGFPAAWMNPSSSSLQTRDGSPMSRSHTISTFSPSRLPGTRPSPVMQRNVSQASTSSINTTTTSKSRGVQMVSEMRAKVRNLEQRLHTRVPRLRLTSITAKNTENRALTASVTTPEFARTLQRRSADLEAEKKRTPSGQKPQPQDSSGWVLIMEDSMSPTPTKEKDGRKRASSPAASPIYNAMTSRRMNSAGSSHVDLGRSNIGRPLSRQSGPADGRDSISTVSTMSSIPTPNSRPTTPTFLPVPTYGGGLPTMKRSTGPGQVKRTSLGSNPDSPTFLQAPNSFRDPLSKSTFAVSTNKSLPATPTNVTVRARPPSALGQSRIGRPTSFGSGRKSAGGSDTDGANALPAGKDSRPRAGSTNVTVRRVV